MSSSATATLFFGIPLSEGYEWPEDVSGHDFSDQWVNEQGPKEPNSEDYRSAEWEAYRKELSAWKATPAFVAMGWHGYSEESQDYIYSIQFTVDWGEIKEIDPQQLISADLQARIASIKKFCEKFDLPFEQPKWHLVAYYG